MPAAPLRPPHPHRLRPVLGPACLGPRCATVWVLPAHPSRHPLPAGAALVVPQPLCTSSRAHTTPSVLVCYSPSGPEAGVRVLAAGGWVFQLTTSSLCDPRACSRRQDTAPPPGLWTSPLNRMQGAESKKSQERNCPSLSPAHWGDLRTRPPPGRGPAPSQVSGPARWLLCPPPSALTQAPSHTASFRLRVTPGPRVPHTLRQQRFWPTPQPHSASNAASGRPPGSACRAVWCPSPSQH